jgi:thermostable 8-oxoguanine DNA glycosylase
MQSSIVDLFSRDPEFELLPGVPWGRPEWFPSPAFWAKIALATPASDNYVCLQGTPLHYELAFCLLGGYGIKMEVNKAAFGAVLDAGLLEVGRRPAAHDIEYILATPLHVAERRIRYRFPRQRAARLANALADIEDNPPPTQCAHEFRSHLLKIGGIGPKTASWIARNWLGSDEVAIIDIHILRAGISMGLFDRQTKLPRDYERLEKRFLDFATAIGVRPSLLDAIIWRVMRQHSSFDNHS